MSTQTQEESQLAQILVEALEIDDIRAEEIVPDAPLFDPSDDQSLGLDSIDALEISLAIIKNYGVQLEADDEKNKSIFYSLRSLCEYIKEQKE